MRPVLGDKDLVVGLVNILCKPSLVTRPRNFVATGRTLGRLRVPFGVSSTAAARIVLPSVCRSDADCAKHPRYFGLLDRSKLRKTQTPPARVTTALMSPPGRRETRRT